MKNDIDINDAEKMIKKIEELLKDMSDEEFCLNALSILEDYFSDFIVNDFMLPFPGIEIYTKSSKYVYFLHHKKWLNLNFIVFEVSNHGIFVELRKND